jgi:hypothetical protein
VKITPLVSALMIVTLAAGGLRAAESFVTEKWPEVRTLVWARPGTSGAAKSPGNWTEYASNADYLADKKGRRAENPPNKETDIVLPDSPDGKSYVVTYFERRKDDSATYQLNCRHITIGKNAGLDGECEFSRGRPVFSRAPHAGSPLGVYGNVTVNDGGYIYGTHLFGGDKHTYFNVAASSKPLGRSWVVAKSKEAGVTLLSKEYELAEGVKVSSGRLVLHSASRLRFGVGLQRRVDPKRRSSREVSCRDGYIHVQKTGALEMRSGSVIGRTRQPETIVADMRIEGLLQLGRAGDKRNRPAVIELGMGEGDGGFLAQHGGLYIRRGARVANFCGLAITSYQTDVAASADKGVSIFLDKTVDFGKVSFDYLRAGGIAAASAKIAKASLVGAVFGKHCAAKGDGLFSTFELLDFSGGAGTVEFVDGLKTDCKILFPHAGRLIVRGKGNRTLQSFDLKSVHAVTIGQKRTEFSAKRGLNDAEKKLRKQNALWGDVPGNGQYGKYGKQEWPDCPVMIWARPGVSGDSAAGANWLDENGAPYFEMPMISPQGGRSDASAIDVLLPAADSPYAATGRRGMPSHRHLVIEQNACYGVTRNIYGNLWMKHGSGMAALHGRVTGRDGWGGKFDNTRPGLHRFLRFDGERIPYRLGNIRAALRDSRDTVLSQYGHFSAGDDGTLELIGKIRSAADRLSIEGTGTVIISEGSELHEGSRSALWIKHGATLALLQDAFAGTEMTQQRPQCYASMIVGGTLKIGLPDKPISRDMRFPLSGIRRDLINYSPGFSVRATGSSFVLGSGGRFVIHSADPKKARVIFTLHDSKRAITRDARYRAKASKARDMALWNPEGIVCYFAGRTEIDGIVFDKVYPGGIIVSPQARAKWKNVSYGRNNLATPEKLYTDLKAEDKK